MDSSSRSFARYALLCGINFYQDKPLRGCVSDVGAVKKYLEDQPYAVQIDLLSATGPIDPYQHRPIEDPRRWPTYANVWAALDKITSKARAGDFVLVHFSGHGTRVPPSSTNQHMGDLALVLLEGRNGDMVRYLHGVELAYLINKMVKKGVRVTVVLDCCYSGGVSREQTLETIRSLSYDPEVDATYPTTPEKMDQVMAGNIGSKDASMLPNWLLNPNEYTIFAACGPHEKAVELAFRDGKRHGALSYFLLYALNQAANSTKTSREIFQNLCAEFRVHRPHENPTLYGNGNLSFFGPVVARSTGLFSIADRQSSGIVLEAGEAQGVCVGDLFTLIPYHAGQGSGTSPSSIPIEAKVVATYALSSDLQLVDGAIEHASIGVGWTAKARGFASLRKYPILASIPSTDFVSLQQIANNECSLAILTQNLQGRPCLCVTVDESGNYRIKDESGAAIKNLPLLARNATQAIEELHNVLKHLTIFRHIKDINNPGDVITFSSSFKAHIITSSGKRYGPDSVVEVRHQDQVTLELQNHSRWPLYFYIYDLAPGWSIEQIFKASHLVVPPSEPNSRFTGIVRKKIRMTVPGHLLANGSSECTDNIKIFVTTRLTSFDALEMPGIAIAGRPDDTTSTSVQVTSKPNDDKGSEDWCALNFQVRTSLR